MLKLTDDRRSQIKRELALAGVSLGQRYRFECFGNTPELAAELGALVAEGAKSATSSCEAVYSHFSVEYPHVGDVEIICDFDGALLAVIEILDHHLRNVCYITNTENPIILYIKAFRGYTSIVRQRIAKGLLMAKSRLFPNASKTVCL